MKKTSGGSAFCLALMMAAATAPLLLTGCGEQKAKAVAQGAAPPQAAPPTAAVGTTAADPHPWIGNKPPPGSAMPPGGPKIPQK